MLLTSSLIAPDSLTFLGGELVGDLQMDGCMTLATGTLYSERFAPMVPKLIRIYSFFGAPRCTSGGSAPLLTMEFYSDKKKAWPHEFGDNHPVGITHGDRPRQ